MISAGTIELAKAGALGGGTIAFESTGQAASLLIDAAAAPAAGKSYGFTLAGTTASSYTVSDDGSGHTLISPAAAAMAQAMAVFPTTGATGARMSTSSASSNAAYGNALSSPASQLHH